VSSSTPAPIAWTLKILLGSCVISILFIPEQRLLLFYLSVVYTDDDDMITVTGGKWTTYRKMAQDAVDAAVATGRLPLNAGPCVTSDKMLIGARGYRPTMHAEVNEAIQQCFIDALD